MGDKIVVEVVWTDASGTHGWFDEIGTDLLTECRSVGYLHQVTKDAVILTRGYNDGGSHMDPLAIPRGNVVSAKRLR